MFGEARSIGYLLVNADSAMKQDSHVGKWSVVSHSELGLGRKGSPVKCKMESFILTFILPFKTCFALAIIPFQPLRRGLLKEISLGTGDLSVKGR